MPRDLTILQQVDIVEIIAAHYKVPTSQVVVNPEAFEITVERTPPNTKPTRARKLGCREVLVAIQDGFLTQSTIARHLDATVPAVNRQLQQAKNLGLVDDPRTNRRGSKLWELTAAGAAELLLPGPANDGLTAAYW